uniref:Ammonium transporter AmtB-like domain-containing protein n=1 Tax=Poecilia latipinna TaxID=48699 RepID=A0A3B3TSB3_9TELE
MSASTSLKLRLPTFVLVLEVEMIALYGIFITYDDNSNAKLQNNKTDPMENSMYRDYPYFADIQVMIFLGFGCLLAFFRFYGFSGMVFNFLTATLAIQWAILIQGYFQFYSDVMISWLMSSCHNKDILNNVNFVLKVS